SAVNLGSRSRIPQHSHRSGGHTMAWHPHARFVHFDALETRNLMTGIAYASVEPIDGTGNNRSHPDWGTAASDLLRLTPAAYGDGVSTPAGQDRPGARAVSNAVSAQPDD